MRVSRFRKACGRFLPKLFRNDAQMRRLGPMPLTARVDTRHLPARLRIAYFADAVPNDDAAINLVADHSRGSLRRSVNGRGVPGAAAERLNSLMVEGGRDLATGAALGIITEDAQHYSRLSRARRADQRSAGSRKATRQRVGPARACQRVRGASSMQGS